MDRLPLFELGISAAGHSNDEINSEISERGAVATGSSLLLGTVNPGKRPGRYRSRF